MAHEVLLVLGIHPDFPPIDTALTYVSLLLTRKINPELRNTRYLSFKPLRQVPDSRLNTQWLSSFMICKIILSYFNYAEQSGMIFSAFQDCSPCCKISLLAVNLFPDGGIVPTLVPNTLHKYSSPATSNIQSRNIAESTRAVIYRV